MQYHIVLIDYGKSYPGKTGPSGFEAVVTPEDSRADVLVKVRDAIARHELVHVKFVDGNYIEDQTAEFRAMAEQAEMETV